MDPNVTFLYSGFEPIARILFITVTGYLTLLLLLRISGQRTLAQMSALDLVITVTLGSAFGWMITARGIPIAEVVAAFAALVTLQWVVALLWGKTSKLRRVVSVGPTLLYYDGEVIDRAMRRHHLLEGDLHTAARQQGMGSLEQARAVLLEANGQFTVLSTSTYGDGSALQGLRPQE